MEDHEKTKEQLIRELHSALHWISALESSQTSFRGTEHIQSTQDTFSCLVEGAPDAVFIRTAGVFAFLNQRALDLFGASSAQDLLGRPVLDRCHPDFREIIHEHIFGC